MSEINVTYLFEQPDLFDEPPRTARQPLMPTARITCRVCGLGSIVTLDNVALLCGPCRTDTALTRAHVETTLATAERRWEAAVEAFDVQAETVPEWAKIEAARLTADPALFAEAWRRRKAAGGPLGDLLRAKEALDALSDEMTRRREWARAALEEIDVYETT